ncbi:hypothetical protein HDU96_009933 [Phlyctochytrium bullatum]|nr:hypothetical protein HDU96_009933 [Phlyctochytrium bullatum]
MVLDAPAGWPRVTTHSTSTSSSIASLHSLSIHSHHHHHQRMTSSCYSDSGFFDATTTTTTTTTVPPADKPAFLPLPHIRLPTPKATHHNHNHPPTHAVDEAALRMLFCDFPPPSPTPTPRHHHTTHHVTIAPIQALFDIPITESDSEAEATTDTASSEDSDADDVMVPPALMSDSVASVDSLTASHHAMSLSAFMAQVRAKVEGVVQGAWQAPHSDERVRERVEGDAVVIVRDGEVEYGWEMI